MNCNTCSERATNGRAGNEITTIGGVMKHQNHCTPIRAAKGCHEVLDIPEVQQFPRSGILAKNANLPLPILTSKVQRLQDRAYSYVVASVLPNDESMLFEQTGSAPNFQGDVLSLCTCKHQMRSRLSADQWEDNVWLVGFTSRIYDGTHWLFYLAKVESAFDSHSDLWNSVEADYRTEKAAHLHYFGDLFMPTNPMPSGEARFSASRYLMPTVHAHRQYPGETGWKSDINYRHAVTSNHAPLLVADPRLTFLWEEPMIYFARKKHCRDYHTWATLQQLMALLRDA